MPITKSAEKALRQSRRRRETNLIRKEAYRDAIKKFKKLAVAGTFDQTRSSLRSVYQTLDKAAKTNVIKKNKASRLKSQLTRLVNKKTVLTT